MPKKGRPRQVLTRMMDTMARVGLPSQDGPCWTSPKNIRPRLNSPMPGSRIHCHATVLSTVGTMNGRSNSARAAPLNRKFWCITSAMTSPPPSFNAVAAAVNLTVFQAACQKMGSFQSVTKLPSPTNVPDCATLRFTKDR